MMMMTIMTFMTAPIGTPFSIRVYVLQKELRFEHSAGGNYCKVYISIIRYYLISQRLVMMSIIYKYLGIFFSPFFSFPFFPLSLSTLHYLTFIE